MSRRWNVDHMGEQSGRVVIVTGSNSGIGYEGARALASKGATVVIACRNEQRAAKAASMIGETKPSGLTEAMALDLSDLSSVRRFADAFRKNFDRLDVLINNAGVMMPPQSETSDGFELQFGVNHLGHFALSGLLLDMLRRTAGSRVVTVSSGAHRFGVIDFDDLNWKRRRYKRMAAYGQSKLANLLFTLELHRRLVASSTDAKAVSSHPGWTRTGLQRHSALFRWFGPVFGMRSWQGALPSLYAATADDVDGGGYYGPDGWLQMRGYPTAVSSADAARDTQTARRLWEVSESLTGVRVDLPA